jgi:hypothetical protein
MLQIADRQNLAALIPSAVTIVFALLLIAGSLSAYAIMSLEAAVCTFSAALTPGACS